MLESALNWLGYWGLIIFILVFLLLSLVLALMVLFGKEDAVEVLARVIVGAIVAIIALTVVSILLEGAESGPVKLLKGLIDSLSVGGEGPPIKIFK